MNKFRNTVLILIGIFLTIFIPFEIVKNLDVDTDIKVKTYVNNNAKVLTSNASKSINSDYLYLSDMPIKSQKVGWGSLVLDKTSSNSLITLIVNGSYVTFDKGLFAHATSTIDYDLSNYSEYAYFTTYYGVNQTSGNKGNGVKFYIYTSVDGKTWDLRTEENPKAMMSSNEANYVKIDIRGAKYLRLHANDNGSNGNDHSVWADAKIIKENYNENVTKTVAEYDEIIRSKYQAEEIDESLELLVLQRQLVQKVGNYQLKKFFNEEKSQEFFNWFFNNLEILKLYVYGGTPDGSYLTSLEVFRDLYFKYGNDLNDNGVSVTGQSLSTIYKKMMVSIALTHSQSVGFWVSSSNGTGENLTENPNISNPLVRYEVYKGMLLRGKLNSYFESLEVEETRYVMNSFINNDEIEWLRDYIVGSGKNWRSAYQFMSYKNVNTALYRNDAYYGDNRTNWENKFKLSGYDVKNIKYYPRVWIIMQVGGVCWQISNVGQNMCASYGVPSTMVGQPGHVAYLVYDLDKNDNGTWSIWNDVSGWTSTTVSAYTGTKTYYSVRLLNGWGNGSYASNNRGSYILLGQRAMNDYKNYEKASEFNILANSYNDNSMKESLYRRALSVQSFNFDSWLGLVNLYVNDSSKTNEDLYNLAIDIANNLKYYPLPMADLLKLINNKITDPAYMSLMTMLQTRTLTEATKATDKDVLQSSVTRTMANYLLGVLDKEVATFAFDGENGAELSLSSKYANTNPYWDYSLDGGLTWNDVSNAKSVVFSDEQVNAITSLNDIKVHIIGVNYTPENIYTIDIKESSGLPGTLYANDLENKLMDAVPAMEWKQNVEDKWEVFDNNSVDLSGNKTIWVRKSATGVYLPSEAKEFVFTDKGEDDVTRSYVSIDHLEVVDFSSQTVRTGNLEYATNAIDGNLYRYWFTSRTSYDYDRYITIKLDKPMYVSQIQYVPALSSYNQVKTYGVMNDGVIYTSLDGEHWTESKHIEGLESNDSAKNIELDEAVYTQYIKIQSLHSKEPDGRKDLFFNAAMFNIFVDLSKSIPTAEVEYSKTETTALSVSAKIVNPSEEITITNNSGSDTYIFDKNGEFIFEFVDKVGNKGSVIAKVDWIVDYNFSFDGDDPYTITLNDKYGDFTWEYSLDGGNTWNLGSGLSYKLNDSEIKLLNADDDLKVKLINNLTGEEEIIVYDIKLAGNLPSDLYGNDWENKVIGATNDMEWQIAGEDSWTSYAEKMPNLKGNKSVYVRLKAHELTLFSDAQEFMFTDKGEDDLDHEYISIDHLEVVDYSSQNVRAEKGEFEYATNAIDGNINTHWHTDRTSGVDKRYIVIKLDEPMYVSQVDYLPTQNYVYGLMKSGVISVSVDGDNWTTVYNITELPRDYTLKTFRFQKEELAQYVKIQCTSSYDPEVSGNPKAEYFINAAIINIYRDNSNEFETNIKAIYSTEELTNKDVSVKIISTNADITITNNNGSDTYTFTKNGEFTFEYVDEFKRVGSYTVVVDWIDKEIPTAEVIYSTVDFTSDVVVVTLVPNKSVEITNNGGNNTYAFTKNGTFTFKFVDKAGNVGSKTVSVDWIKIPTKVEINYNITNLTNKDVVAIISGNNDIKVIGSDTYTFTKNGEYVFEYIDKYGDIGYAKAIVDWIDKKAPTAEIEYSTLEYTEDTVIATLIPSEAVEITNNDGKNTYEFTKNGEFTFEYKDMAGNVGKTTAKVDWIKEATKVEIEYSVDKTTVEDVVATLKGNNDVKVIDSETNSYTFEDNGKHTFYYIDKYGNVGSIDAVVSWIDKSAPTAEIEFSTTELTNKDVEVKLINPSKKIKITNNDGSDTYKFSENGHFVFEYVDELGNRGATSANVTWIDKDVPTAKVEYSTTEYTENSVVATIIPSETVEITNNDGNNTYEFTKNGEFIFEYKDIAGNIGRTTVKVDWIIEAIVVEVEYSEDKLTNKDVVAIVKGNNDIKITNNNESNVYLFTKNGEFTFEYVDKYGRIGAISAKVSWIDKEKPTAEVEYSTTEYTEDEVIVTINPSEEVNITNNGGSNTYTFVDNGEFTFEYVDKAGNVGTTSVKVDWIIKPTVVEVEFSNEFTTAEDVIATLKGNNDVKVIDSDTNSYIFTNNGTHTFKYVDKYGRYGSIDVVVSWIDKNAPIAEVEYSTTELTNKEVVVKLINPSEEITITNNGGSDTYTFSENGHFVFEYVDNYGNVGTTSVNVTWIDKEKPTAEVEYSTTDYTKDSVIVTLVPNEIVEITNNGGKNTYEFTKNGEFTFEYKDLAGNIGKTTVKVDWIMEETYVTISYNTMDLTNKDVIATIKGNNDIKILNNNYSNEYTFTTNGEFTFIYVDKYGNKGTMLARVSWIDKVEPTAEVEYSEKDFTETSVLVTLVPQEDVTITNNDGKNTYEFIKNGEYTFEYVDKAGNTGSTTVFVNWIVDKTSVELEYSTKNVTNEDVEVIIKGNNDIKVTNNNGKKSYIFTKNGEYNFEYVDKYGRTGTILAKVDWIDKDIPNAKVEYSTVNVTTDSVKATLLFDEDVIIINNNSKSTYEFTKNGEFTFEYMDMAGNIGMITARVNWILDNQEIQDEYYSNDSNYNKNSINNTYKNEEISSSDNIKDDDTLKNEFLTEGVSVKLNYDGQAFLKKYYFDIDDIFKGKVGNLSVGMELYLEDKNGQKLYFDDEDVRILVKIDQDKEFNGIYLIDGNNLKQLTYKRVDDETISVNTKGLGKYILSYIENDNTIHVNDYQVKEDKLPVVFVMVAIVAVGGLVLVVIKNKNDKF